MKTLLLISFFFSVSCSHADQFKNKEKPELILPDTSRSSLDTWLKWVVVTEKDKKYTDKSFDNAQGPVYNEGDWACGATETSIIDIEKGKGGRVFRSLICANDKIGVTVHTYLKCERRDVNCSAFLAIDDLRTKIKISIHPIIKPETRTALEPRELGPNPLEI